MKRISRIIFSIIAFSFIAVSVGCDNGSYACEETAAGLSDERVITENQLIGVWQTADFADTLTTDSRGNLQRSNERTVELYFTEDFKLYVHDTEMCLTGHSTVHIRFALEIESGGLVMTPENISPQILEEREPQFVIYFDGETVTLSATNADGSPFFRGFGKTQFSFVKVSDEVPYGWTDTQRQEIAETNQSIRNDIFACADKFAEAIGLSVLPSQESNRYSWHRTSVGHSIITNSIGFLIDDDIVIAIRFIGDTPSPSRVQRHTDGFLHFGYASGHDWDDYSLGSVRNNLFVMFFVDDDRYEGATPTEEMLDIFVSLLDSQ